MRISALDPGAVYCAVTIDGATTDGAVACDTTEGWADIIARDAAGQVISSCSPCILERRHGVVVVTFSAEGAAIRRALDLPVV